MGTLISALIGFFSQGVGSKIGNTVANGLTLAALAPLAIWFLGEKDKIAWAVTLTWGDVAVIGLIAAFVLKLVHYTRAGTPDNRGGPL